MSTAIGSYGMRNTAINLDRMSDVNPRSGKVSGAWRDTRRPKKGVVVGRFV